MRKSYSKQLRLDSPPIDQVELNFGCRDSLIPVLQSLQHVYSKPDLTETIMQLVARDINGETSAKRGREGMDYWHILVLASVRLGCNYTYDQVHDLSENHIKLRAIMGLGSWDEQTKFKWQKIRDGLRKILDMCSELAVGDRLLGWRQHDHLWKKVKQLAREIDRIAGKKGPNYVERMKKPYRELLQKAVQITQRARDLCMTLLLPIATIVDVFGPNTLHAFIARPERVIDTATRRVLKGETVPNSDKLFSVFEPHTQLYIRGKAGEPIQFGRQVLVFEDAAGFIVHKMLMKRDQCDSGVAIEATKALQKMFDNKIERVSFDRGFHSPVNQIELSEIVPDLCLPKPGAKQSVAQLASADDEFRAAQQNHPGVESAIGALQSGNGMKRCRDRSEIGFERYVSLAILGRNMHTLGRLLIAQQSPNSEAALTRRHAA